MTAVKIDNLTGMIPIRDDRLLPINAASYARDCWLYSGASSGFNEAKLIHTAAPGTGFVYRIPKVYNDALHMADSVWMEFIDPFTDVLKPAVVGDQYQRYYWASPTTVPQYNTLDRIQAGQPAWLLGVPPANTPTVTPSGGVSATLTSRAYVVTWMTAYREEGPPSLPANVSSVPIDSTFTVNLTPPLEPQRNITTARIYRTITTTSGAASYFLVAEVPVGTTVYTDTASDATVGGNAILESDSWFPPPSDLQGWVTMPNGMVAGWRGKEIWFCEPYRLHAWPPTYAISVDFNIVGLGVAGQTLIVCTDGYPYAVTGINPALMASAMVNTFEPCLTRGSILTAPEGVYFASPNGLILAAQGQLTNVTLQLFSRDKWQMTAPLASMTSARLGTAYYAFGTQRLGAFQSDAFNTSAFEQTDSSNAYTGIFLDPLNPNVFSMLSSDVPTTRVYNDVWSGELFLLRGNKLYWLDQKNEELPDTPYLWRSKVIQGPYKQNYQALKAYWHTDEDTPVITQDPLPNNALNQTYDVTKQYGLIRVYADGNLIATREVRTPAEQMRLPSGFKADYYQVEFEGVVHLFAIHMATSAKELREV